MTSPNEPINQDELYEKMASFEKMVNLGILAMGMAHEINNAINYIFTGLNPLKANLNNVLDLLKKYGEINNGNLEGKLKEIDDVKNEINLEYTLEEIDLMLNALTEGAKRTTAIVKDLQNYSQVAHKEKEKVDINKSIDSSLNLLLNKYKNRIEIVKSYGEIPELNLYSRKISQVFMNLLINAIQAIPDKGKIFITTKKDTDKIIISIRDTGEGMTPEVLAKVFDLFFTTKPLGGTGLGMPIAQKIIQEHGGELKLHSKLGEGTEIEIHLPL